MSLREKLFVEVRKGTKVTLSESDLNKMDRMYERELAEIGNRKVMTPYRKEPQRSFLAQLRDYAFEKILDRHLYTFSHLLVIPNPYGLAKQTALLLFNSSKEYKVRYRVIGDHGNDFVGESQYATRHRIGILGLYLERSNRVDLCLIDREGQIVKHREIRIYVSEVQENQKDLILNMQGKGEKDFPFLAVNGAAFNPLVFDGDGEIRYSMQLKTNRLGMLPMPNGHVLFADRTANIVNRMNKIQPCLYHEMDYLGRVYRTYVLSDPVGTAIAQHDDSLFLVTSSDGKHYNDCILQLDMNTGEITRRIHMTDLLGEKYHTGKEWLLFSAMEYREGKLLLTLKRIHTIAQLDLETEKLDWVLAPECMWKDTELEEIALKTEGQDIQMGRPDKATWISEDELLIYSTGTKGAVKGGYHDPEHSAVLRVRLDEQKGRYEQTEMHECLKTMQFGSALDLPESDQYIFLTGVTADRTIEKHSQISMVDRETDEVKMNIDLTKNFLWAWKFNPVVSAYSEPMDIHDKTVYGSLQTPEEYNGPWPEPHPEKIRGSFFANIHLCENMFMYSMLPGVVEKVFFKGENKTYVQDYTMLPDGRRKEIFAVQVDGLEPGEYDVYVQYQGMVRKLRNEVRVKA
ncbi:MAG: aryl-sulfate sulfotransferase [Lachnospiraceae bacterium]|nr:aryl-sulfate sulfotransferase [Lachnospiraceae bacterium]